VTKPRKLTDGRIVLEPYAAEHVNDLVAAVRESRKELMQWLPWCHENYGAKDATEWLRFCAHSAAEGLEHQFAVRDENGRFVGGLGLRVHDPRNRVGSIGYWTRSSAVGRGIATAATRIAARFGFAELGLRRIEIFAAPENRASRRVAERAGAQYEGIARNRILRYGVSEDSATYALVPGDLQASPGTVPAGPSPG
jgi:RimJ/RimL family protein N-acetyltransferase